MKKLYIVFLLLSITFNSYSQPKKEVLAQVAALKEDTSKLQLENLRLNQKLHEVEAKLSSEKQSTQFCKLEKERSERKLSAEIEQLSFLLERALHDSTKTKNSHKVVYFGSKDEFHGYNYVEGVNVNGSPDYISIPFGVNRHLINSIDLSNFSLSNSMNIFYKVEISGNGNVTKLWCNEKKSKIKNRDLLRLIGEEIKRQAKYSKIKVKGKFLNNNRLVELSITIPQVDIEIH